MDPAQELELSALALQEPMNAVIDCGDSDVQQFYSGATVFMTGGSGFIGKQLIEKLFRSCAITKMFLLMRSKKAKTIQERLNQIFKDPLYDGLRIKDPQFADKIICVEGDVTHIRLGLSKQDWKMLTKEVNIIFHVAATVRFDEPLRKATSTNVRGTREVLELARNCINLKQFVHVSTAFANATEDRKGHKKILEQFYPGPLPPETLIALAEEIEESRLDNIKKDLIAGWPNTYTFTKCVAEELIRTTAGDLPVCIVRPPIVLPAYYDPVPGWLDLSTLAGPSGLYFGAVLGVLHVYCADANSTIPVAPVDHVKNIIIASAWDSAERRNAGETEIPIYNIAKNIRFGMIAETMRKEMKKIATPKAIWRCEVLHIKSKLLYFIVAFFLQYVPAYIVDSVCSLTGRKPKQISSFVDVYRKSDKLVELYVYFTNNAWSFKDDNIKAMIERMSEADKAIFNCDLDSIDLINYILVWGIGLRKYILKDGLKGTKLAYRKQQMFIVLNWIVMALYGILLLWICTSIYSLLKYTLS